MRIVHRRRNVQASSSCCTSLQPEAVRGLVAAFFGGRPALCSGGGPAGARRWRASPAQASCSGCPLDGWAAGAGVPFRRHGGSTLRVSPSAGCGGPEGCLGRCASSSRNFVARVLGAGAPRVYCGAFRLRVQAYRWVPRVVACSGASRLGLRPRFNPGGFHGSTFGGCLPAAASLSRTLGQACVGCGGGLRFGQAASSGVPVHGDRFGQAARSSVSVFTA